MLPEVISTRRLVLRPIRSDDTAAIFERWAQDPEVSRWLTWRPAESIASVEEFVQRSVADWPGGLSWVWTMTLAGDDAPIGTFSLRHQGHMANIGYAIMRALWGQGLMTEAASAVVDLALAEGDIFRVWAICDAENVASARVLEKAGMTQEGVLRRWIIHPNVSAEPRDARMYPRVR